MRSAGDDLISVAVVDTQAAQALAAALRQSGGWIDAVAGIDSVVVHFDLACVDRADAETRLKDAVANVSVRPVDQQAVIEIPIVYGGEFGPDLEQVCEKLGLTKGEFVALHSGEYTVDMIGFTPGFAYVGGLDDRLVVERHSEPRQHLPAGSIGIAGGRTGIYAVPGPGGWPWIGRTARKLFDASSDDPFLLSAGATVVFTAVETL